MVVKESIVDNDGIGMRLDKYLGGRFTYHSRTEWQDKIENGTVKINGTKARVKTRLKKGDVIVYQALDVIEPEVNKNIEILYDDGDLLVCSKPPDLPVIPAGKYHDNTFYTIMKNKIGGEPKLINRIDRETSGCIMMARTSAMASAIQNNYRHVRKLYVAIAKGAAEDKHFTVICNIGGVPHKYYRQMQGAVIDGKYSKTEFFRAKTNGEYSLFFCRIFTGKRHQIRAHLREKNLHIVGDKVYGEHGPYMFTQFLNSGMTSDMLEKLEMDRQALHAYKLYFTHPLTKKHIVVKAPIPKDMRKFMKKKGLI